ncbi:MAG: UDP-N-acetylglucosamine 1-carboxyvinyltransferase [Bacillota bacterium]
MKLVIAGSRPLSGVVRVGGAKNAALKIMAASLLAEGVCRLSNVPRIADVDTMVGVLRGLGARVGLRPDGSMSIDPSGVEHCEPPEELVKEMRASIQVMGPLLARLGYVRARQPGGCNIGPRPIDLHLKGFAALGASITEERGYVSVRAQRLKGAEILLDIPSVGATENIMMAACLAEGTTVIRNAAREPEIVDQQNFLVRLGAKVRGAGTDTIRIEGVESLGSTDYAVIPDRIEAGTFMVAAAMTGGTARVENVIVEHVQALIAKLREAGAEVVEGGSYVVVRGPERLRAVSIRTLPYPGFPTDVQPQFVAAMSVADGTSIVTETIFPNRFRYTEELRRMGANVRVEGRVAVVQGVPALSGAHVEAPDLRGGAALILGGLVSDGTTELTGVHHIDRGYEDLPGKLAKLGAAIERVETSECQVG